MSRYSDDLKFVHHVFLICCLEKTLQYDCWVCYDADRTDAGAMIFPCTCKGDVAAVHEACLKRWLMEVSASTDP